MLSVGMNGVYRYILVLGPRGLHKDGVMMWEVVGPYFYMV